MIFTLGYARKHLGKFVDAGKSADSPEVADRINEAIMQLLMIEDWHLTTQTMRFFIHRDTVVLPHCAERIIKVRFDDRQFKAGHIWSKYWEFADSGLLGRDNGNDGMKDLRDLGDGWPTFYEIPANKSLKLVAFSNVIEDADLLMEVRGWNAMGEDVTTVGSLGATMPINMWRLGVEGSIDYDSLKTSDFSVREISAISKPLTKGYITLMGIDLSTKAVYQLAKYQPGETNPGYHRYKVVNANLVSGSSIKTIVKMRYVPAIDDNDPLLIQNIPALKSMLQSLRANDARQMDEAITYKKECIWLLNQQLAKGEPNENEFTVEDSFGLGSVKGL